MEIDSELLTIKKQKIETVRCELKREFFGIDSQIDKIMDTIKTWYVMPQLFERPLIINLWGLTGVGKTSLVRKIVEGLNFSDRFLEMQMGGGENSNSGYWGKSSVFNMLQHSKIKEGEPGIILFDEFQRFRTIGEDGKPLQNKEYQDIWQLLSDGYCAKDFTLYKLLDDYIEDMEQSQDDEVEGIDVGESKKAKKAKKAKDKNVISVWEAQNLSKMLDKKLSYKKIMSMSIDELSDIIKEHAANMKGLLDYTKCLCIISGNLDEAFSMSESVDDADTDADYYYEYTKKISIFKIKTSLQKRFKPEQIARLGNNNIIYPSLNKCAYTNIIKKECNNILEKASTISNIKFILDDDLIQTIYENSVFPTQGTRPVFSSIHHLFGSQMSEAMLWGIENNINSITISINKTTSMIEYSNNDSKISFPIELQILDRKKKYTQSYKSLIAVHEAGHALMYTVLKKMAPYEIKINLASWNGGYNLMNDSNITRNKKSYIEDIIILLSGRAAEKIIFGIEHISNGAGSDIKAATFLASSYIRSLGLDDNYIGLVNYSDSGQCSFITDCEDSNTEIINILQSCRKQSEDILFKYKKELLALSKKLIENGELSQREYTTFMEDVLGESLITTDTNMLSSLVNYEQMIQNQIDGIIHDSLVKEVFKSH